MATIINPGFESLNGWTVGRTDTAWDVPVLDTYKVYTGTYALKMRLNCGVAAQYSTCYARQQITAQKNHTVTFLLFCYTSASHEENIRILFNGNVLLTIVPENLSYGASGHRYYRCHSPAEWRYDTSGASWRQFTVSLASYEGQTGDFEIQLYRPSSGGSHLYCYEYYFDSITESYEQPPTDHWYVRPGGSGTMNGYDWNNAMATVDAGMKAVAPGKTLHVGFGSYTNEPANNVQSPTNANVTVVFETIGSTGGTGTSTVELN